MDTCDLVWFRFRVKVRLGFALVTTNKAGYVRRSCLKHQVLLPETQLGTSQPLLKKRPVFDVCTRL